MQLLDVISKDNLKVGIKATTKKQILKELANFLATTYKDLNEKTVFAELQKREEKGSTGVGKGLAVPHCRIKDVNDLKMVVVYDPNGKDFDSFDNEPSKLFVVVAVGKEVAPNKQLEILSTFANLYEKTNIQDELNHINTVDDLYNLLKDKSLSTTIQEEIS